MPKTSLFRRSLIVAGLSGALCVAAPTGAHWLGTEPYTISILLEGEIIHYVDVAEDVEPGDVMYQVFIGETGGTPAEGAVTVVGEGSGAARKQLGGWSINYGTGNVEGVVGSGGFDVGQGGPSGLPGVLHVLSSDLDPGGIDVNRGSTLTVEAGSKVKSVEVHEDASAYVTLFSEIGNLTTHDGAYVIIQQSVASSTTFCDQVGSIVIVEDSTLRCSRAAVENGADVEIRTLVSSHSTLDLANALTVRNGSLGVSGTVATTGSIVMAGANTHFGIAASNWANAGGLEFQPSAVVGPVEMTVGGGAQYRDGGTARVSGHPAYQHLTVTGDGTEFELDGDLRIGEYISSGVKTFSGNVTVADGATLIVHGTLVIKPLGVLNLEPGGTVYAEDVDDDGTINENGGTLVLPEAQTTISALTAIASIAALSKRTDRASAC